MIRLWCSVAVILTVAGCSSSPYDPVNQTGPIRAMDSFFSGGRTDAETPPLGYHPQRQQQIWVRAPGSAAPAAPDVAPPVQAPTQLPQPAPVVPADTSSSATVARNAEPR